MGVNITKTTLGNIPILMYEGKHAQRCVFLQHGIYGNKEKVMQLMGVTIAQLGYVVVAIDTVGHGERGEQPFVDGSTPQGELRMFDLIEPTAEDILAVYDVHLKSRFDSFDYIGISLGGLVGYHLASQTDRLKRLHSLMSTPNYEAFYEHISPAIETRYQTLIEQGKKKVQTINPSLHPEKLNFERLYVYHGVNDQEIPLSATTDWLKETAIEKACVMTFETGHKINKAMFEALKKHLTIPEG